MSFAFSIFSCLSYTYRSSVPLPSVSYARSLACVRACASLVSPRFPPPSFIRTAVVVLKQWAEFAQLACFFFFRFVCFVFVASALALGNSKGGGGVGKEISRANFLRPALSIHTAAFGGSAHRLVESLLGAASIRRTFLVSCKWALFFFFLRGSFSFFVSSFVFTS